MSSISRPPTPEREQVLYVGRKDLETRTLVQRLAEASARGTNGDWRLALNRIMQAHASQFQPGGFQARVGLPKAKHFARPGPLPPMGSVMAARWVLPNKIQLLSLHAINFRARRKLSLPIAAGVADRVPGTLPWSLPTVAARLDCFGRAASYSNATRLLFALELFDAS
jgi:hypothetical protein